MLTPSTRYLVRTIWVPLLLITLMRALFWWLFRGNSNYRPSELWTALGLGVRFDLRVILVLALPNALLLNFRYLNPRWSKHARTIWRIYWVTLITSVFAFYLLDFGYYDYLKTHTNATALRFLVDFSISMQMLWQSYPVVKAFLVISSFALLYNFIFANYTLKAIDKAIDNISFKKSFTNGFLAAVFFVIGLYGKIGFYPLRWSDAYFSNNSFLTALAVNPVHYFFDTLRYRKTEYNIDQVKKYLTSVREYLALPENLEQPLELKRVITSNDLNPPLNVVVIVLESQAAFKTGLFGNPANPTPHLDQIAKRATLFRKHYVPSEGTARSIFGLMTAIPDVNTDYTSSRNPLIASQNLIINDFKNHKKFYFLGGSTSWGNIRGLISYNIPGVEIVEEGRFTSERNDVWGISDLDLFKEAHQRFESLNGQSFFAVIQTAGFHRPYTIPDRRDDFNLVDVDVNQLKEGGFDSLAELNSLRFQDYSLGKFFTLAEKGNYFSNTLFVIQGDHGLPDNNAKNLSSGELAHGLSRWHVPLVFYSPRLFPEPRAVNEVTSELDVMTTVASLAGITHTNTTLGRNLFGTLPSPYALLYTYYEQPPGVALIDSDYLIRCNSHQICSGLYSYNSDEPTKDLSDTQPKIREKMESLALGLFETSKYLLYHNPNPLIKN